MYDNSITYFTSNDNNFGKEYDIFVQLSGGKSHEIVDATMKDGLLTFYSDIVFSNSFNHNLLYFYFSNIEFESKQF